ncbi:unnamed protein product [Cochlearia groenlandica]
MVIDYTKLIQRRERHVQGRWKELQFRIVEEDKQNLECSFLIKWCGERTNTTIHRIGESKYCERRNVEEKPGFGEADDRNSEEENANCDYRGVRDELQGDYERLESYQLKFAKQEEDRDKMLREMREIGSAVLGIRNQLEKMNQSSNGDSRVRHEEVTARKQGITFENLRRK